MKIGGHARQVPPADLYMSRTGLARVVRPLSSFCDAQGVRVLRTRGLCPSRSSPPLCECAATVARQTGVAALRRFHKSESFKAHSQWRFHCPPRSRSHWRL